VTPRLVVLAVVMVLTAAAVASAAGPDWASLNVQPYEPPKPAPAFSLPDLDGKSQTLDSLQGKVVLLFFWASW
jgi:cytochrome oxidase Cu insertion factor (SCO1/SenC/PrrC family)